METIVVNLRREDYDIYIGRGKCRKTGVESKWGNPFSFKGGTFAKYIVSSREEAIEKCREWILKQPELLDSLHELKGKKLGCYCKPLACHGDILIELLLEDSNYEKNK
jgi:hypothetical protein